MVDTNEPLWIFGYSSLIWKYSDVEHVRTEFGFVEGYTRRFWQSSTDHRGTPERPGLVASLYSRADFRALAITEAQDPAVGQSDWRVHGRVFEISGLSREKVIESLDGREVDGYVHKWEPVCTLGKNGEKTQLVARALVYIAPITSNRFAGPLSHDDIVKRVLQCHGNSGSNREYLENLALANRKLDVVDPHLEALVRLLPSVPPSES